MSATNKKAMSKGPGRLRLSRREFHLVSWSRYVENTKGWLFDAKIRAESGMPEAAEQCRQVARKNGELARAHYEAATVKRKVVVA